MKHAARRPGLGHVGAEVLHRERLGFPLDAGIEFREAMKDEVTGCPADVAGHLRRLVSEPVALETHRDDAVVVRPHRAILIRERVVSRVLLGQGPDAPAAPHVRFEQAPHDPLGPVRADDAAPEEMAGVRGDGLDRLLVAVQRVGVGADVLAPEVVFEALLELGGLLPQAGGQLGIAEVSGRLRQPNLRVEGVALELTQRLGPLHQRAVRVDH